MQGMLLASDSFPGQDRSKLCMASKVTLRLCCTVPHLLGTSLRLLWCPSAANDCCLTHRCL